MITDLDVREPLGKSNNCIIVYSSDNQHPETRATYLIYERGNYDKMLDKDV